VRDGNRGGIVVDGGRVRWSATLTAVCDSKDTLLEFWLGGAAFSIEFQCYANEEGSLKRH
jgi:hypothetical protein